MASIGDLAEKYEELVKRKKDAAATEKDCSEEIAKVEEQLLVALGEEGLGAITTRSGMNLHRKVEQFVSTAEGVTKEQLINVLANHDCTRDLVSPTYNTNSLRARLKEIQANGEQLPEEISKAIRIIERDRIGYRS